MSADLQPPPVGPPVAPPDEPLVSRPWVLLTVAVGLVLAVILAIGLPAYADHLSSTTVPQGAIAIGRASLVPSEGWELATPVDGEPVTLQKGDATIEFSVRPISGQTPTELVEQILADNSDFVALRRVNPFTTPSGDPAAAVPAASSDYTAFIGAATDTDGTVAAEVFGVAPSESDEALDEVAAMISSLRIREAR